MVTHRQISNAGTHLHRPRHRLPFKTHILTKKQPLHILHRNTINRSVNRSSERNPENRCEKIAKLQKSLEKLAINTYILRSEFGEKIIHGLCLLRKCQSAADGSGSDTAEGPGLHAPPRCVPALGLKPLGRTMAGLTLPWPLLSPRPSGLALWE